VLLFANAIIGYWEEREAGNAIDALKARLAIKSRVRRDGKWVTLRAKQLEPGDVIRLRLGDIVPADARLRQCDGAHARGGRRPPDPAAGSVLRYGVSSHHAGRGHAMRATTRDFGLRRKACAPCGVASVSMTPRTAPTQHASACHTAGLKYSLSRPMKS